MKSLPRFTRRGSALVITLALVVLLTFVVVAFFVRATSNLSTERAGGAGREALLLAKSAANLIVSDLQGEMRTFSTQTGPAYFPLSNTNMIPTRKLLAGVNTNDPDFTNLIKQSGTPMFDGSPSISVNGGTPTSTASSDGRVVTASRWSTPMLTGAELPDTPNWIYINRDTTLSATPSDQTIGRFAYNVYDIGSLLDINAAGFAPKSGGGDPGEMPTKGGQVWADLRSIPGIDASAYADNAAWPPKWRIRGDWAAFTADDPSGSLPWYHASGWMQPYVNASGTSPDRMFTSRQDLIRYAKTHSDTFTADAAGRFPALQYLTTFSREANQPGYQPPANRPKVQFDENQGGNDARGLDDTINPGARDASGEALVKKRFALDHIGLLSADTPDTAKIHDKFGLTRSGNTWVYNHGSPDRILSLAEVPATRTPDFFEMLKAAIHAGSLGVQHGTSEPVSPAAFYRPSLGFDDAFLDYQIIQIGANIIDQADDDSYPVQIEFNGKAFAGVENLPYIDAIACVALPERIMPGIAPPDGFEYSGDWTGPVQAVILLMPRLWNPHSGNPGDPAKVPTDFRVRAQTSAGGADHFVQTRHNSHPDHNHPLHWDDPWRNDNSASGGSGLYIPAYRWNYAPLGGENYGPGEPANPAGSLDGGMVGFSLASGWQSAFPNVLSDPRILSHPYAGSGFAAITGTSGVTEFSTVSPWIVNGFGKTASASSLAAPYDVFGFPLGRAWMGPMVHQTAPPNTDKPLCQVMETWGGPVKLILECRTASGDWLPYDEAYYFPQAPQMNDSYDQFFLSIEPYKDMVPALDLQGLMTYAKFDPRSKRWGSVRVAAGFLARGTEGLASAYFHPRSMRERDTIRQGGAAASPPMGTCYLPVSGQCFDPAASSVWSSPNNPATITSGTPDIASVAANTNSPATYSYLDPDGIRRRGSSAYWNGNSFDGQPMANYYDPSTGNARPEVARSRPVVLNRPFRSVAELGYVFRDTPWRNIDLFTAESGDAALLDFFCVHDTENVGGTSLVPLTAEGAPVVAGKVNLNTRHPEVLAALIRGVARENQAASAELLSAADALIIAQGITDFTASADPGKGPFVSLADLVGRPLGGTGYAGFSDELTGLLSSASDKAVKQRREAVVRALADAGGTRTWNVLIDVIAQSGIVPSGTTKFIPRGERRIWASTAIDRHTAKVIDSQWEVVNE